MFGWFRKKPQTALATVPAGELRWRRLSPVVDDPLPRFQSLGSDVGPLGGEARERNRVRDAFSPTRPISDLRLFAGRGPVLNSLIRSIEELNLHVIVYGERGIGKTSLLHVLSHLAREARYRVTYHSCGEEQSFSDIFRHVAGQIPLLFDDRFRPAAEETERGETMASLLPAGNFNASQLTEAFSHLSNTRLLILLDEFDRSPPGNFRRNIAELIKNLSDRSVKVQLVIAGVAGNLLELVEHIPSIRRNIYGLRVPSMDGEEVAQLIEIGERISRLPFSDAARERVTLIANGSPYLASVLAQYASFKAVDDGADEVEEDHVTASCEQVADELRQRLSDRTVAAIDRALESGLSTQLLLLSGLSMRNMGRLDEDMLRSEAKSGSLVEVAQDLEQRFGLLREEPNEDTRRLVFREEAIPYYLWVRLVCRSALPGGVSMADQASARR